MKCEQIREMLSPYIDGMTSEKENKIISAHLENCSHCQSELEHLRMLCVALKNLPVPELPERFSEELHKRLVEEQNFVLRPKEIKTPKKSGWIAAGVAGIALAAGIYASSVLPITPMIASWQEKHSEDTNNKPSLAINEIINRIYSGDKEKVEEQNNVPPQNPQKGTQVAISNNQKGVPENKPDTEVESNAETTPLKEVSPKLADVFSTRIMVKNAAESADKVVQLARNNEWEYAYTDVPREMAGPNSCVLTIKVNEEDVDKVISQLGEVGKASVPLHNRLELTQQYSEIENQISLLQKEKETLQQTECADQCKLDEIEKELKGYLQQKSALDKELEMTTLEIYFVGEINP
jgi:hypothetical protein